MGTERMFLVAIKTEVTEGVDAFGGTPGASDWFVASKATCNPVNNYVDRNLHHASGSKLKKIPVKSHSDVVLEVPMFGASAAGSAPPWDPFLMASGHKRTLNVGVSAVYAPSRRIDMTDTPTLTVYIYEASLTTNEASKYMATGVRGTIQFNATEGQPLRLTFTGQGTYNPWGALAAPPVDPTAYVGATDYTILQGCDITVGGASASILSLNLATRGSVAQRRSMNATAGLAQVLVVPNAVPAGSMELNDRTGAALAAILAAYEPGNTLAIAANFNNGVALSVPFAQFLDPQSTPGDINQYGCPFEATSTLASGGDDDYTLTITAKT